MTEVGRVQFIHLAPSAGAEMRSVATALAIAGQGLEGDRYAKASGHWSSMRRRGDQLTLIESEEVERVAAEYSLDLPPGSIRRNLTTRGVRLDELLGRRFRIGPVTCLGVRRCEPCAYLDGLLKQEALPALVHRAGIRAEILSSGVVSVSDVIEIIPDPMPTTSSG